MGFDAYLWKKPRGEANTPYDFDEVCEWSGRRQYGWMHKWLSSHGSTAPGDPDVRILSAKDLLAFHEELVRRHNDSPSEEDDAEILRVAGDLEPVLEESAYDDRFSYYGSF